MASALHFLFFLLNNDDFTYQVMKIGLLQCKSMMERLNVKAM
jgi:hypothetical protein